MQTHAITVDVLALVALINITLVITSNGYAPQGLLLIAKSKKKYKINLVCRCFIVVRHDREKQYETKYAAAT